MHADCLPGATVTVCVNGEPLTEHATENSDLSATTFVEAVSGSEFEIALNLGHAFTNRDPADRINFCVSVDGEWVRTLILTTHMNNVSRYVIEGPLETQNGVTTLKRLTFAEHASSDNRADDSTMNKLKEIGQIKVKLQRCRESGVDTAGASGSGFKGVVDHDIPEKALKGRSISSHTKLGRTETMTTPKTVTFTYPYGDAPIATYIFQYRSRKDLEIEGIIERAPSPVPLEERDPEELTAEELRKLLRRSHAEKASATKIKPEFKREKRTGENSSTLSNEDEDEGDVTVMSESNRRKRSRLSVKGAEVIDISDD